MVGFGLRGGSAFGLAGAGVSSVAALSSPASAESAAFLSEFGVAPGALEDLSGGALVLAPSGGFDVSVDPEAFVAGELPAGDVLDGTGVGLEGGAAAGCCATGKGSGVIDGVVDEFVGADVAVDAGEDAGDSVVPG